MNRKLRNSELNRLSAEEFKKTEKTPIIIVLDNIRSLNNIGSVFRTSDAFVIEAVYLCGISACPPHRDIHKTALGAEETVDWEYFERTEDAIIQLKDNKFKVYSIEQVENSIPLQEFRPINNEKYALVFGNEVKGVQQNIIDISDGFIEIPQYGTKHSFNISVTTGIVLWEIFKKMKL